MGLGVRASLCCIAGDRRCGFDIDGGRACPTEAATLGGLNGDAFDFVDDRCDWECECECEDRGGGLEAVEEVTMMACFRLLNARCIVMFEDPF